MIQSEVIQGEAIQGNGQGKTHASKPCRTFSAVDSHKEVGQNRAKPTAPQSRGVEGVTGKRGRGEARWG